MSKHRTISTGIQTDEHGIHILIEVDDGAGMCGRIYLSGAEASDLIPKLRLHIDEIMTKLQWYSPEDWK